MSSPSPTSPGITLVLVEHEDGCLKRSTHNAVTFARLLCRPYGLLVMGSAVGEVSASVRRLGAEVVLVADDEALGEPLADRCAAVVALAARQVGAAIVLGPSSSLAQDVLPRAAALLDAPMASDVVGVAMEGGEIVHDRLTHAGNVRIRIVLEGPRQVVTVRSSAFAPAAAVESESPIEAVRIPAGTLSRRTTFVSRDRPSSTRPGLGDARVVVSGGRPLKDRETFERLVGGLADVLGGAVGATRAAVDAGMVENCCQVGQTAKVVAPEVYIAVGISGSIQHVAGMMDSRLIVAINRDPDAPIFKLAHYGIVADLHQAVPQLIAALRPGSPFKAD